MQQESQQSKTICPHCFSTNVRCQAWINPNTKEFCEYIKSSLEQGQCFDCGKNGELIPVSANIQTIDNLYREYITHHNVEPHYVQCLVTYTDHKYFDGHLSIKLTTDFDEEKDQGTDHFCNGLDGLKSLCEKSEQKFVIRKIYCFDNK